MNAKAWELRATVEPRAHARGAWPSRREARAMLADIYGWFTEGFDTCNLKDAKAFILHWSQPRLVRQAENAKI